jgi:flagellar protein FliJ
VIPRFRFRLEQVLDHRTRREDLARQELAHAAAAAATQQQRVTAADEDLERDLATLRDMMGGAVELDALRAAHDALALTRSRARHERTTLAGLEALADERRQDLVRASQEREALTQLRLRAHERHRVAERHDEAITMDELAMRRTARARAVA